MVRLGGGRTVVAAAHQQNFLPWLGFFDKMSRADVFVVLDDVQIDIWVVRNRIRTPDGFRWITLPVQTRHGKINEVKPEITDGWIEDVRKALRRSYGDAKIGVMAAVRERLVDMMRSRATLDVFNMRLIEYLCGAGGLGMPEMVRSSDLGVDGSKGDRLVRICREVGADVYLSGAGGREYIDVKAFRDAGIEVEFQEFSHPVYRQTFSGFVQDLSAVDKLLCTGVML